MSTPLCNPFAMLAAAALAIVPGLALVPPADARNASETAPSAAPQDSIGATDSSVVFNADRSGLTYADLVDLALASPVVARAVVRHQFTLKPEDSPGVQPGFARVYVEADTQALLTGPQLGESLRFLTDLPLDAKGKVAKLVKTQVMLFGNVVPGKPGELALTAADTMFGWTPGLDARVNTVLRQLITPDAPPRITGLREALHVPGNLVGEGETQVFLATDGGKPVSLSVVRRPGEPTRWGVSFSEIVDQSAMPPASESLAWYRLACALPRALPDNAMISGSAADRQSAAQDYALVLRELGPCRRNRFSR